MREQCSSCKSYNEPGAAFCSQCGKPLAAEGRSGLRVWRLVTPQSIVTVMLLILIGVVLYVAYFASEDDGAPASGTATGPGDDAAREEMKPREENAPRSGDEALSDNLDEAKRLTETELGQLAQKAMVVIELQNDEGRPLRDIRGVLAHAEGAVLCRFRPLLGAYGGTCRLAGAKDARVGILGLAHYDMLRDVALLRVDVGEFDLQPVPVLEDPPDGVFEAGDGLFVFSGYRLKTAVISEPYEVTAEGVGGIRLDEEPRVVPETFMAMDAYGYLVGLCRPLVGGRFLSPGETVQGTGYRIFVDPLSPLVDHLERPVVMSLFQLTTQLYEGTFAALAARGERAYRRKNWAEAAELLEQAIARAGVDGAGRKTVDKVFQNLRESYLHEIQRFQSSERHLEAADLAAVALERFPRDATFWAALADARFALGLLRDGIDALLEVRAIEPGDRVAGRLEDAYLTSAAQALAEDNSRLAEGLYLEGLEQLPRSARLHMDLARLYQEWEAYDEAVRLLHAARELDRSLSEQIDVYLDRIDDILKRRDAVVIPISADSGLIRAKVIIDDRREYPLIVDTGATHTTLPWRVAEEMGYDVQRGEPIRVRTAGGSIEGRKIRLRSLDLRGYAVRNLEVIVLPERVGLSTGLLGLNFLNFFKYGVDKQRGEFRLERP